MRVKRKCLKCQKWFDSSRVDIRICDRCHRENRKCGEVEAISGTFRIEKGYAQEKANEIGTELIAGG
jgi:Zn finger protein HypA/HybF involved in hydrogenase expression